MKAIARTLELAALLFLSGLGGLAGAASPRGARPPQPYDGTGRYQLGLDEGGRSTQGLAELAARWGVKPYGLLESVPGAGLWQTERVVFDDVDTGTTIVRLTNDPWTNQLSYYRGNWRRGRPVHRLSPPAGHVGTLHGHPRPDAGQERRQRTAETHFATTPSSRSSFARQPILMSASGSGTMYPWSATASSWPSILPAAGPGGWFARPTAAGTSRSRPMASTSWAAGNSSAGAEDCGSSAPTARSTTRSRFRSRFTTPTNSIPRGRRSCSGTRGVFTRRGSCSAISGTRYPWST